MTQFETKVSAVIQRTHNVKSFCFDAGDVNFKPGQFFFVTIEIGGEKKTKHFSFSNSPTEKGYVEFTKRITESEFSRALDTLKAGDWASLRMPMGSFTFEGEYKKIAFLSGGIGITPIRSMCKFIVDSGLPTDAVLLYANRTEEDIIFKEDFDQMQEADKNIRAVYALDKTGHIDENMIRREIPDFEERVFYTSGPPGMVKAMTGILRDGLGLPHEKIKTENFTGY